MLSFSSAANEKVALLFKTFTVTFTTQAAGDEREEEQAEDDIDLLYTYRRSQFDL